MKKVFLSLAFVLGFAVSASAQAVTDVQVTLYRQGSGAAVTAPLSFSLTQFSCGQVATPAPGGTVVNPTQLRVPDPTNQNLDCVFNDAAVNSLLNQLGYDPVNVYFGRARYVNVAGAGPESPDSNPFSRPGTSPTAAPASLRWGRGQ